MTKSGDFRDWMASHRAVGDGAMATWLHQLGVPARTCYESLCLSAPHLVRQVHQQYVDAGADVIQTNTFNAHGPGLERYGIAEKMEEINRAAVELASSAAGEKAFIFGTVGSIAGLQAGPMPWDDELESQLQAEFQCQLAVLLDTDIDGLLIETFADLAELRLVVQLARSLTDLPIIAHLSPETPGVTRDGVPLEAAFHALKYDGADVVGLNCQLGLAGILRSYEAVDLSQGGIFSAYPNAGLLEKVEDDVVYTASAEYFGDVSRELFEAGVSLVGGCCGTTPGHVKAIVRARSAVSGTRRTTSGRTVYERLATVRNEAPSAAVHVGFNADRREVKEAGPHLLQKARTGTTVIVELDPPRTLNTEKFMTGARRLAAAGADFITMADNSLGHVRVSNLALASQLKQQGIEPLVHVTCRDRNLIGQQSHLMGLHVLDIHHILLVTGDPSRFGNLPGSSSVYDTSSTQLTAMVKRLNRGIAFSGEHLAEGSRFVVGTAFNPNVANVDRAYDRLQRKLDAGADFIMTQPVFSVEQIQKLAQKTAQWHVPVFVGIMPLVSARNAYFLHNEVPGIDIPASVLQRMLQVAPEFAAREGLNIAKELLSEALKLFHTLYLITPFLRFEMSEELLGYIKGSSSHAVL